MDLDLLCEHVLAYVEFNLHSNTPLGRAAFEAAINKIPEFMYCVCLSDDTDYISFTCFADINSLNACCNELSAIPDLGIKQLKKPVILERAIRCLGYPLEKLRWIE
ncbi:MAG: Lrp/AsnC family leucine-responsive transcriptional regulator [Paraglaciecola sp.]|jgi:Lrp/AsnC family leucine-responsive transcriptional regulator